ncbi:hypothetical protein SO3561_08845 [Streptomyces olivochromogenes]|uniref:Uncharacterized protein n=1 Tax=Streptomyces olivochromogenes TaxID=1963 RepID=A0A250VT25_STROL|nr:hypothetical protein SO3561_08845 [Streptomyces olivochromogenes]
MIADLLSAVAIVALVCAWTFLATVRWARFDRTPPERTRP